MRRPHLFLSLTAGLALAAGSALPVEDVPMEKTRIRMRVAMFLLQGAADKEGESWSFTRLIPLWNLRSEIPESIAELLPTEDGWSQALFIRTETGLLLVSPGPDGALDLTYDGKDRSDFSRDVVSLLSDDILADGSGITTVADLLPLAQRATMGKLRLIASSVELFAVINDSYPGPTTHFEPTDTVAKDLARVIRDLPVEDTWGNPLLYWSDQEGYCIVSFGSDGAPDQDYDSMDQPPIEFDGQTTEPEHDIIFANGSFVQWPNTMQT